MDFFEDIHLDRSCNGSVRVNWEDLILKTHDQSRVIVEREGEKR